MRKSTNARQQRLAAWLAVALAVAVVRPGAADAAVYYWDNTAAIGNAGFGTAGGTWNVTTGDLKWSTSSTGVAGSGIRNPTTSDDLNFGSPTDGLATGTITVSGTVSANSLTSASTSGNAVLSGGTINLDATATITQNGSGTFNFNTALTGAGTSLTFSGSAGGGVRLNLNSARASGATIIDMGNSPLSSVQILSPTATTFFGTTGTTLELKSGRLWMLNDTSIAAYNTTVTGDFTLLLGRATAGAAITNTFGTLNIGASQLNVVPNGAIATGLSRAVFGNTTFSASGAVFDIEGGAGGATASIQLGSLQNNGSFTVRSTDGTGTLRLGSAANVARTSGTVTIDMNGDGVTGGIVQLFNGSGFGSSGVNLQLDSGGINVSAAASITPGHNTTVGGDFRINLNPATTTSATFGTLSIGANTLRTGAYNANGNTAVTFGATTLTGNATFNTANNGSLTGTPTLTLGAVGQTGGSRSLTKDGSGTLILSGVNTYTGDTLVNAGTLDLTSTSEERFLIQNGNVSNGISGVGAAILGGLFRIDTSLLGDTSGVWKLVDVGTLTETWGGGFGLAFVGGPAFANQGGGLYTSGATWSFDQTTGNLTLVNSIPTPAAMPAGLAMLTLAWMRRRR